MIVIGIAAQDCFEECKIGSNAFDGKTVIHNVAHRFYSNLLKATRKRKNQNESPKKEYGFHIDTGQYTKSCTEQKGFQTGISSRKRRFSGTLKCFNFLLTRETFTFRMDWHTNL